MAIRPVVNAADLPWCDTMATDGYYIYVNPAFCARLTGPEIAGVFAHELLHCIEGKLAEVLAAADSQRKSVQRSGKR